MAQDKYVSTLTVEKDEGCLFRPKIFQSHFVLILRLGLILGIVMIKEKGYKN